MQALPTRRSAWKALAGASAAIRNATAAARGHNVLFLMSDEHSPHVAGWLGNKVVRTPALDALAARGAAFPSAYCQNPICVPSRASLLTGRMPWKVGVFGNTPGCLDASVPTLADVFRRAGYVAGWMGKTHWGGTPAFVTPKRGKEVDEALARRADRSRLPQDAAIADYPVSAEFDTITKNQALRFLEENRDKPFFAGVSFRKPHFPFLVQEKYFRMYEGRVEAPRVTRKMIDELPPVSKEEREKYGFAGLTEAQIRKALAMYYGMVTYIDDQVGEILGKLDALGLRDNTIILYTADHGEMGGEHGLWYKNSFYEASARIPHVWSFPKELPRGVRIEAPVMNMDIFPTLCDLCGLPKPDGLEGRSLAPLMKGTEKGDDRSALSENFRGAAAGRMIRTGPWKYCYYRDGCEQLFDLRADPEEAVNLVRDPRRKELVASLQSRALRDWDHEQKFQQYKRKARENRAAGITDEP
jgi:choline-sulfatase